RITSSAGSLEVSIANGGTLNAGIGIRTGIVGESPLTKSGPGILNLTSTGNEFSRLVIDEGNVLAGKDNGLGTDNSLGTGSPDTPNALGTLRYTASTTTARSFTLNGGTLEAASGVTLTLNGATIAGGFPVSSGTGKFQVGAGGALFTGSTLFGGTAVD